ncbi:phage baseplate assembly protein V [Amphritea sp. HPY]|uniref:phage baseplate assembly protein V n=1 Tax=Amphritea sp. HPY TaxID=3421652 RepID=UPI003D7D4765
MSMIKTLVRRLARKVLRGIVTLSYDDTGIQRLQVKTLSGDVYELPRVQQYGYTSNPHAGAEGIVLTLDDAHGVVVAVDDRRYRMKGLKNGEVALYDDTGNKVHLQRSGKMHVTAPTQITFDSPLAHFTGNLTALGQITDLSASGGVSMEGMRSTYNTHDHDENNTSGATDAPNQEM